MSRPACRRNALKVSPAGAGSAQGDIRVADRALFVLLHYCLVYIVIMPRLCRRLNDLCNVDKCASRLSCKIINNIDKLIILCSPCSMVLVVYGTQDATSCLSTTVYATIVRIRTVTRPQFQVGDTLTVIRESRGLNLNQK